MKKEEQKKLNEICYNIFDDCMKEFRETPLNDRKTKKLRSCSAEVIETENYYILKSYNTFIACIEKENDILIDVLRTEYGYTSTSAQHIAKFSHDYCKGKWNCAYSFTSNYAGE